MANISKLNSKFDDKLKRKKWQLDNAAGWNRLADEIIVGEKERGNGCFSAAVSVLAIVAAVAVAFGASTDMSARTNEQDERERLCENCGLPMKNHWGGAKGKRCLTGDFTTKYDKSGNQITCKAVQS